MNAKEVKEIAKSWYDLVDEFTINNFVKQVYGPRCIHLEIETTEMMEDDRSFELVTAVWAYQDGKFQIQPNFAGLSQEDLWSNYSIKYSLATDIMGYLQRRIQEDDIMEIVVDFYNKFGCPVKTAVYELRF